MNVIPPATGDVQLAMEEGSTRHANGIREMEVGGEGCTYRVPGNRDFATAKARTSYFLS